MWLLLIIVQIIVTFFVWNLFFAITYLEVLDKHSKKIKSVYTIGFIFFVIALIPSFYFSYYFESKNGIHIMPYYKWITKYFHIWSPIAHILTLAFIANVAAITYMFYVHIIQELFYKLLPSNEGKKEIDQNDNVINGITLTEFNSSKFKNNNKEPNIYFFDHLGFLQRQKILIASLNESHVFRNFFCYPSKNLTYNEDSLWKIDLPIDLINGYAYFYISYAHPSVGYQNVNDPFSETSQRKLYVTPSTTGYNPQKDNLTVFIPDEHVVSIFSGNSDDKTWADARDIQIIFEFVESPLKISNAIIPKVAWRKSKSSISFKDTISLGAEFQNLRTINIYPKKELKTAIKISCQVNQKHIEKIVSDQLTSEIDFNKELDIDTILNDLEEAGEHEVKTIIEEHIDLFKLLSKDELKEKLKEFDDEIKETEKIFNTTKFNSELEKVDVYGTLNLLKALKKVILDELKLKKV